MSPISDEVLRRLAEHAHFEIVTDAEGARPCPTLAFLALRGETLGFSMADMARDLLALREAARGVVNLGYGISTGGAFIPDNMTLGGAREIITDIVRSIGALLPEEGR